MSIEVSRLSKSFGKQTVIHQLSFKAAKGQILGFLGPNGAGKTTTIRMITGYLRPSQGTVYVGGDDVNEHPRKVKAKIGYLSEHNPLYLDMYVHEYLRFIGGIYGLKSNECTQRAKEVVKKCGITEMQNKKLAALSKGYRQRVGVAQALIHDPEVLILDEPTTGLDPNQLHEIRAVIKEASKEKTVILSTHIMQEVEALCEQVVIIDHGKMVANNTLEHLAQKSRDKFVVEFKESVKVEDLEKIAGVKSVHPSSERKYLLYTSRKKDMRETLFRFAKENDLTLLGLTQKKNSLEEVFQRLTGSVK
ncbi:MAG: gliding motility-associated ABC transporter ATP-binding subunit GldA [Cytophagales bacterium]|nr:gliding motility-associated ABC transporter ATP-binding subunit GldA [Cytophagales bacterium]